MLGEILEPDGSWLEILVFVDVHVLGWDLLVCCAGIWDEGSLPDVICLLLAHSSKHVA